MVYDSTALVMMAMIINANGSNVHERAAVGYADARLSLYTDFFASTYLICLYTCCAVPCRAVPCRAVLRCAVLCYAVLDFAGVHGT